MRCDSPFRADGASSARRARPTFYLAPLPSNSAQAPHCTSQASPSISGSAGHQCCARRTAGCVCTLHSRGPGCTMGWRHRPWRKRLPQARRENRLSNATDGVEDEEFLARIGPAPDGGHRVWCVATCMLHLFLSARPTHRAKCPDTRHFHPGSDSLLRNMSSNGISHNAVSSVS